MKRFFILLSVLFSLNSCASQRIEIETQGGIKTLSVEIADDEAERQQGLMNRTSLAEDHSMLFIFESERAPSFWMKDTLIPLDMLFIDKEGVIRAITKMAPPCTEVDDSKCSRFSPGQPVLWVLEIAGGVTDKLGIRRGDKVKLY